jgi:hypothetical protein
MNTVWGQNAGSECQAFGGETKSENTFLPNALRLTKERCVLEGSQASHVCPSGKSNIQIKISMKDRWNDDKETRSIERKPRPSADFSTTNLTRTDMGPNQGFRGNGRRLNASAITCTILKDTVRTAL